MLRTVALTVMLVGTVKEMKMGYNQYDTAEYRNTAYAIRIGKDWFAGFGGKPGQETLTKTKIGLCDAKLIWDAKKAVSYIERLKQRGFIGEIVKVTA